MLYYYLLQGLVDFHNVGNNLVSQLELYVDPFDLDVVVPHINVFVQKQIQTTAVSLCTFIITLREIKVISDECRTLICFLLNLVNYSNMFAFIFGREWLWDICIDRQACHLMHTCMCVCHAMCVYQIKINHSQ